MALRPTDADTYWIAVCVRAACLVEATARKPGNVHPEASFADLNYEHFRRAADVLGPILARASVGGVGRTVLEAVEAMRDVSPTNANLGIILLIAPLAAVPPDRSLARGIEDVLASLTVDDARHVYTAIRLAQPGGLGRAGREDVSGEPTVSLREAMALAADRDSVARQYVTNFADVLQFGVPLLQSDSARFEEQWETAIIRLHLEFLSRHPDSLIARKCGLPLAEEASARARAVLNAGWPLDPAASTLLDEFDRWLRADGNRRNPGTTADLVAASLFAAFRERAVRIPPIA